jgi:hypothetical protein
MKRTVQVDGSFLFSTFNIVNENNERMIQISIFLSVFFQNDDINDLRRTIDLKKWVLFLLIAGFVLSNIDRFKVDTGQVVPESLEENIDTSPGETLSSAIEKGEHHYLLVALDNGKVKKAVIAKMVDGSKTMGIASVSNELMEELLSSKQVDLEAISKDNQLTNRLKAQIGVPIDHIIAVEKNGYIELFSRIFPEGIPLPLSEEMKKDVQLVSSSEIKHVVKADEFFETIKILKQTQKYDKELNQMIVDTVSSQLSKPDVPLALLDFVNEVEQYFFTDLTMTQLISMGINIMSNPVQEVQKLEVPLNPMEEV